MTYEQFVDIINMPSVLALIGIVTFCLVYGALASFAALRAFEARRRCAMRNTRTATVTAVQAFDRAE